LSFSVKVAKKYHKGAKKSAARSKLEISAAVNLCLSKISKWFCIFAVEIAKSAAIIIAIKNGAYKRYIQYNEVAKSAAIKNCGFI
jgi:hypothetical protein